MLRAAALLLFFVGVESWPASELRRLAEADDVSAIPHLERAVESSLSDLRDFADNLAPPDVEDELIEALLGLERLDPRRALPWCRRILELYSSTRAAWAARSVLARSGDTDVVRTALREYFRSPEAWRRVLGEAAHATNDVRLRDYRSFAGERRLPSDRLFRSRLAYALSGSPPTQKPHGPPLVSPSAGMDIPTLLTLQEHVLSLPARERLRAVRVLVERDDRALLGLPMSSETIARLSPYLARSRYRALRDRARRGRSQRGLALASLLLSPMLAQRESGEHAESMRDAWADAMERSRGEVYERLRSAVGEDALARWMEETKPTGALVHIPLPSARERLEQWGTPLAVAMLGERPDVALSIRTLDALRRSPNDEVRFAAEKVLLRLAAPGATTFLRGQLSSPALSELLPAVLEAPLDRELERLAIERVCSREGPEPDGFAAMSQFHERHPRAFLSWLGSGNEALIERAHFVMALSGDARRIPLLIDLAVVQVTESSRNAAFRGLAEAELGSFERRLHRLAGHPDRRVRFQTAVALVPTGQAWSLRLLVAELDEDDRFARGRARRAVERLARDEAKQLLEAMVSDGTARSFAIGIYLDLCSARELRASRERLWQILEPEVAERRHTALLAAARLSHPAASEAVQRFLTAE